MAGYKKNGLVEEAVDLSKYGKDFQLKLLLLLVKDRSFSLSIIPIIRDSYFSDIYLRTVYDCIKQYVSQYKSTPSIENIKILLRDRGEKMAVYEQILKSVESISLEDRDFVVNNTRNFCFTKHALVEMEKVLHSLRRGEFEEAQKISTESFKYSGAHTAKIFDIKEDYRVIFDSEKFRAPIETPFPIFNKNTKGGIGGGDLGVIVAASNFGKSAALTALSRHANVNQKNVVYFSFEMGHESVFSRYIAGLLDIPQEELKYNEKDIDTLFKEKNLGIFKLIQERATNANVGAIASQLEYLKSTGFFPDMVCVDALNQLKAPEGKWYKDDNAKFEALCEQLRDLAGDLGIPIWTACQTNRSGWDSEINDIKSIGKAIEIFQVADIVISFAQKPEFEEKQECVAVLIKNRHGKKNIAILCHYDPNRGVFVEKELLNQRVLMTNNERKQAVGAINHVREKLKLDTGLTKK